MKKLIQNIRMYSSYFISFVGQNISQSIKIAIAYAPRSEKNMAYCHFNTHGLNKVLLSRSLIII